MDKIKTHIKDDAPRLLSIKKASVYSGIPIWGIRSLIWNEQIPFIRIGKKLYLDVEDIENWIKHNKVIPESISQ